MDELHNSPLPPMSGAVDGEYRSLSSLAVVALVLGLCSFAALAGPLLAPIPVAGIGAAVAALVKIRRSAEALTGAGLARCGLLLSCALLVAVPVRDFVRNRMIGGQVDAAAARWTELLTGGDFPAAREMLSGQAIHSLLPPQKGPGDTQPTADAVTRTVIDGLKVDPLTKLLASRGPATLVAEGPASEPLFEGPVTTVTRSYQLAGGGNSGAAGAASSNSSAKLQMSFRRAVGVPAIGSQWFIDRWQMVAAPVEQAAAK